jgi:hypothetical protein
MIFRRGIRSFLPIVAAIALLALPALAADVPDPLPDPDGEPADMSKPVQVYILMGQSNMIGSGKPSVLQGIAAEKYPYLVDDAGAWTVRKDVRNVFVMCSGNSPAKDYKNEWMTISGNIGPEMGIGHYVGHVTDAPVLILKSCIGNRSLGWDLLPPGSEPYEHGGKTQPGYRGTPDDPGGDTGGDMSKGWYAGCQYDGDVAAAKKVLENLDKYYPGATEYEVKGFFWWQGDKDMRNPAHFNRYGQNLVQLIRALRQDFDAPHALFVTASLGQTKMGSTGGDGKILDAMKAVAESDHEELQGKVGFVYAHPLSKGGGSSGHYGGNPETYMNVGEAMGKAMVELLKENAAGGEEETSATPPLVPVPVDELPRYKVLSFKRSGNKVTAKVLVEATPEKVPSEAQLAGIRQALAEKTEHQLLLWLYVLKMNYDGPPWATATTSDDGEPRVRRFDNRLPPPYATAAETPD